MKAYISETKQTLWLSLPFIANQILQMSVITIDSVMAGADGTLTLAAVSQGVGLWDFVALGIIGVLAPLTALIANAYARQDNDAVRHLFQQAVWLMLPLGMVGFMMMWWVMPSALHWFGVDGAIIPPAQTYLTITAATLPLLALFLPVRFVIEGIGKPSVMMFITISSIPINIIGNYVLLNGLWGFPKMGVAGIAIATLASQIYLCAISWWFVLRSQLLQPLNLLKDFSAPVRATLSRFMQLGIPSAVALLMEVGLFTLVILLAGRLGVDVAAANQIAFNYSANTFMIPLGMSMALSIRVGAAMGNNDMQQVRRIGISGIAMGAAIMLISAIIILLYGEYIATAYSDDAHIIALAIQLLVLVGVFQLFDGIQVCAAGVLRGMENTHSTMIYATIGYWVLGATLAVVLAFVFDYGAVGLWWGLVVGLATTAVLATRKFYQLTKVTVKKPTQAEG